MRRRRRKNTAEGAEIPYEKGQHIPTIRGGYQVDYFWNYPNAIGSGSFTIKE
jgi:hypothetical protein